MAATGDIRVAIIGCGVGGLAAAYTLSSRKAGAASRVALTLYEAGDQLGGHAQTVSLGEEHGGRDVDVGFLVYNENTYPNLIGMLEELGVDTEPSDMSFAVSLASRTFEWSSRGLSALFATRSNLVSPAFHSMLADLLRFSREGAAFLETCKTDAAAAAMTMREYLDRNRYSAAFRHFYLVPEIAAVWSASAAEVLEFPAATFITFCINHSLLQILDRPQWRTISRRSREYVRRVAASLDPATTTIRLRTPVRRVQRVTAADGRTVVRVEDASGGTTDFDHVIFGAHPDEVLTMLGSDATSEERTALGGFRYQPNTSYLHSDTRLMPSRTAVWSSWNYMGKGTSTAVSLSGDASDSEPCCVSYWLNLLQNLPSSMPNLFVTLNPAPHALPAPESIIKTFTYSHPQYSRAAIAAQAAVAELQGRNHTWFAGAYLGYGFHEDGATSGIRAAVALSGRRPSWWNGPLYTAPSVLLPAGFKRTAPAAEASTAPLLGAGAGDASRSLGVGPSPVELRRMRIAAGGPYWRDNLGNGGPVGIATREAQRLLAEMAATADADEALAAGVGVGAGAGVTATAALAAMSFAVSESWGAAAVRDGGVGVTDAGDMRGFVLRSPSDVLAAYRHIIGAGEEVPATSRSAGLSRGAAYASAATALCEATGRGTSSGGGRSVALDSGSESGSEDRRSSISDGAASNDSGVHATSVARESTAAITGLRRRAVGGSSRDGAVGAGAGASGVIAALHVGSVVSGGGSGSDSVKDELLSTGLQSPSRAGIGLTARIFKSAKVGAALVRRGAPAATRSLSLSPKLVGELMAAGKGGYTGQEKPVQSLDAFPTVWSWATDALRTTTLSMLAAPVLSFLKSSIVEGCLLLRTPDGIETAYGDPAARYPFRARIRVHSWAFFAAVAAEADLGLARSFRDGEWTTDDLTAVFNVFVRNRDNSQRAAALSTQRLWTSWLGTSLAYVHSTLLRDNSRTGSRDNIHAHYDLSNDLFASFLDPATMMYSCGFFETTRRYVAQVDLPREGTVAGSPSAAARATLDATIAASVSTLPLPRGVSLPSSDALMSKAAASASASLAASPTPSSVEVIFRGSLEDSQLRKLDHLIARAGVQRSDRVLDLGFGWGGLSIRLAETVGCRVHGITLSKEQYELASERVTARGLGHLVTFEIIDYRDLAARSPGAYDKIISVEMIEAVGHNYLPTYFEALDRLLAPGGTVVLQAITMPEGRYEKYVGSVDFINTVIFPGGCCPSTASIMDAVQRKTNLTLQWSENFALHYGETLRRWRANFNAALDTVVRPLGFDDAFIRTWNYYLCYCEAGFTTQTLGLQVLTFTRPGTSRLVTDAAVGRIAEPLGPFTNDPTTPVLMPAGVLCEAW